MNDATPNPRPGAVLFACNLNSVRSPMAAGLARALLSGGAYFDSAGVEAGEVDPFATEVMRELKLDITTHISKRLADIDSGEFDLIVALTPQARDAAQELSRHWAVDVEYWETPNPSDVIGGRDAVLASYRAVRDDLKARIAKRFGAAPAAPSPQTGQEA